MQIFIYARAFKWLFASRAQTWVDPGALQALLEGKLRRTSVPSMVQVSDA